MHSYLRSIGFTDSITSENDVEVLLDNIFHSYDERKAVREPDGKRAFVQMNKSFGPNMGIVLCGELDVNGFHRLYYYPYLTGSGITTKEDLSVERKVNGDGYTAMCEDGRVGVSLIYYIVNPAQFKQESVTGRLFRDGTTTTLSALAQSGIILLPLQKDEKTKNERRDFYERHDNLVSQAKNGDQQAIESLTLEDMDTYAMITRRVMHEDIFSIVDTYFMPHGMDCERYQVMGTILFYTKVYNSVTGEGVWQMQLECNGMIFDVCIGQKDLLGDPEIGRRFKGNIWLQGKINFESEIKS